MKLNLQRKENHIGGALNKNAKAKYYRQNYFRYQDSSFNGI